MSTQLIQAKNGIITDEVRCVAKMEKVDANFLREKVAQGRVVILKNSKKVGIVPVGIGEGLRVKVSADIGLKSKDASITSELDKLRVIEQSGADVLIDSTSASCFDEFRQEIISSSKLPVGGVPLYQTYQEAIDKYKLLEKITKEALFSDIERQCADGVDFIRVHCGVTKFVVEQLEKQKRLSGIVSKGGAILACWIKKTGLENPLYKYFDELLEIVKEYDTVLSLSCGLRTGSIADSCDRAQFAQYVILGELAQRARQAGVQVMVEGLGHCIADNIASSTKTIKELTMYSPLFTRDTLVCDCALGYDNITSAIGSTIAACSGANMLSVVTSANYLGYANPAQIREGIISAKIASHAADIAKGNKLAIEKDVEISKARANFDWKNMAKYCIDETILDGIDLSKMNKKCLSSEPYSSVKLYKKHFD